MLQYYQKNDRTTKAIAAKSIDYKRYRQQKVSETKGVDLHFSLGGPPSKKTKKN